MSLEFLEKQSLEFGKLSSNTFHEFVEIMNNNQIYTLRIPRRFQVTMVKKRTQISPYSKLITQQS